jgi:hypothetical protein
MAAPRRHVRRGTRCGDQCDQEWCVVVGCGFRVRHLRVAGAYRTHGADPGNILWLDEVEALGEHTFRLRGGSGSLVHEYVYDADSDRLVASGETDVIRR